MRIQVDADEGHLVDDNNVIGYSIVSVIKTQDGGIDVNRYFTVGPSWSEEDKQVATDFLKQAESKLSELFPKDFAPGPNLWVPNGD